MTYNNDLMNMFLKICCFDSQVADAPGDISSLRRLAFFQKMIQSLRRCHHKNGHLWHKIIEQNWHQHVRILWQSLSCHKIWPMF